MTEDDCQRVGRVVFAAMETLVRDLVADEARRIPYEIQKAVSTSVNELFGRELRARIRQALGDRTDVMITVKTDVAPTVGAQLKASILCTCGTSAVCRLHLSPSGGTTT